MSRQPSVKTSFTETWGYAMRCILQAASHLLHARIRGLGLAQPQWLALVRLTILENPTAAQLARHMGQDAATMMRVLEKLEARGLITRTRSQTDRRVLHLALSAEGRRLTRLIEREAFVVQEQMLRNLSDSERTQCFHLLSRIQADSEALAADVPA